MTADNPIASYFRSSVEGASPEELVGLLYEGVVAGLHRAIKALEAGAIEPRVREINRCLAITAELRASLDFERGGKVAESLRRFYEIAKSRMLEASIQQSKPLLLELAEQFHGLREAWRQVEHAVRPAAGNPPPPPRHAASSGIRWSA